MPRPPFKNRHFVGVRPVTNKTEFANNGQLFNLQQHCASKDSEMKTKAVRRGAKTDLAGHVESDADSGNENKDEVTSQNNIMSSLESKAESLRISLVEKRSKKDSLERDLHEMNSTIQKYQDGGSGDEGEELDTVVH